MTISPPVLQGSGRIATPMPRESRAVAAPAIPSPGPRRASFGTGLKLVEVHGADRGIGRSAVPAVHPAAIGLPAPDQVCSQPNIAVADPPSLVAGHRGGADPRTSAADESATSEFWIDESDLGGDRRAEPSLWATSAPAIPEAGMSIHHNLSDADRAVLDRIVTFAGLARIDGTPQFHIGIGAGALANTSLAVRRLADRRIAVQVSRIGGGGSLIGEPGFQAMIQALEARGISVVLEFAGAADR